MWFGTGASVRHPARYPAVIAIGVATLAPLIGGEGLGREIYAGLNLRNSVKIYAGAIRAALLVILTDIILGRLQRKTKDWTPSGKSIEI